MGRVLKQSSLPYIGLFVIFFGLYAREHRLLLKGGGPPAAIAPGPIVPAEGIAPLPISKHLQELTDALKQDSLFQVRADGLSATYSPDSVTVIFYGDEVYSEGYFAFRETWYTALDRVADLIKPFIAKGMRLEVIGYTDEGSLKERKPSDYGESDYALSFARAEWVARYFERRSLISIKERVKLTGAGAVKAGRKVELKFTFDLY